MHLEIRKDSAQNLKIGMREILKRISGALKRMQVYWNSPPTDGAAGKIFLSLTAGRTLWTDCRFYRRIVQSISIR